MKFFELKEKDKYAMSGQLKDRFELKGMNLEEGGTTIERNEQVGGHSA